MAAVSDCRETDRDCNAGSDSNTRGDSNMSTSTGSYAFNFTNTNHARTHKQLPPPPLTPPSDFPRYHPPPLLRNLAMTTRDAPQALPNSHDFPSTRASLPWRLPTLSGTKSPGHGAKRRRSSPPVSVCPREQDAPWGRGRGRAGEEGERRQRRRRMEGGGHQMADEGVRGYGYRSPDLTESQRKATETWGEVRQVKTALLGV